MEPQCPQCRKRPAEHKFRPFCSRRCQQLDLGGWLSDRYTIPAQDTPSSDQLGEGYDPTQDGISQ